MKQTARLMAIGLVLAAACAPRSTPEPTSAPTTTTAPGAAVEVIPSAEAGPTNPTAAPVATLQQPPTREQVVQVQPDDWVRGPETAAVTIIEWGDFQ